MTQETTERSALSAAADDLFRTRSEIKRLTEIETQIKDFLTIAGGGATTIDGSFVRACLKTVQPAPALDHKALIEYLMVSPQVKARFMKEKDPYTTITLKPLER